MRRREFITMLGGTAVAGALPAAAQKRTALIGLLGSGSAQSSGIFVDSLKEGLSEGGLREGRDYVLDLRVSPISSPDNIMFDKQGNMWISTDGQIGTFRMNDGIYVVPTKGPDRGFLRQLLSGIPGGELAAPALGINDRFLFASIQHPAEGSTLANPTSKFPDGATPRPAVLVVENAGGFRVIGA